MQKNEKSRKERISQSVLRQKRIPILGEVIDSFFTTLPILSAYSGVSVTIILYETIKEYMLVWFPWMTLGYFILILVSLFSPLVILVYKYVIPSVWHFRSTQMSHLEGKIDKLSEQLKKLQEGLNENSSSK